MNGNKQIAQAVHVYRTAYAEYSRHVRGVPVIPRRAKVYWTRQYGWKVDGTVQPGTAEEITNRYGRWADELYAKIRKHYAGQAATLDPEETVGPGAPEDETQTGGWRE